MSTPRTAVADQLRTDTGYKVHAFPYFPAQVADPVLAVWRTDVNHHPDSPNHLRHPLRIQVYVGPTVEEKAEATLDDALDAVLLSLQRQGVNSVTAERTVFGDEQRGTFQGWAVTCNFDSPNVYKSTILAEG
jgi:hypothetical protein